LIRERAPTTIRTVLEGLILGWCAALVLTVTIYPKRNGEKDENPVGNTPLCVTGTAEELDHELPGLIAGYAEELGKFHSNLGQIKQQLADAAIAAAEAAKVKTTRKPATAPAKAALKSAEPAEPPVARPDLFTASMPPAAAAPETEPAPAAAADGTVAIRADPGVVQPPVPSAATAPPRERATPMRGKAVERPPLPGTAAAPIPALAGDPIGLASEEDDSEPEPVAPAKPAESVLAAAKEMGWADEDETAPVEVAAEDARDNDDDSCPF
jgi:PRTRC genetic system protein E